MASHMIRQRHGVIFMNPLTNSFLKPLTASNRRFLSSNSSADVDTFSSENEIVIPKKKKWDATAVLKAINSTVTKDPTAWPHFVKDDPYLIPSSSYVMKRFFNSMKSGERAAEHVIKKYPELFHTYNSEPPIEAFLPKMYRSEEASEEGLREKIENHDPVESYKMYTELRQQGATVPPDLEQELLELLCFHGGRGQADWEEFEQTWRQREWEDQKILTEDETFSPRKKPTNLWEPENIAETMFNSLSEKSSLSYTSVIRGMIKWGEIEKAWKLFEDMKEDGLLPLCETYNDLISTVPTRSQSSEELWQMQLDVLTNMAENNISPNATTFNNMLINCQKMDACKEKQIMQIFGEMKAANVEPTPRTLWLLLEFFYDRYREGSGNTTIAYDIMELIKDKEFRPQHMDDFLFLPKLMATVFFDHRDLELAHQTFRFAHTGNNRLLLCAHAWIVERFYEFYLKLVFMYEKTETAMGLYEQLVPSVFASPSGIFNNMLTHIKKHQLKDKIPWLWRELLTFKLYIDKKAVSFIPPFAELMVSLNPSNDKLKEEYALIAEEFSDLLDKCQTIEKKPLLKWSNFYISLLGILFSRNYQFHKAWKMLEKLNIQNLDSTEKEIYFFIEEFLNKSIEKKDKAVALNILKESLQISPKYRKYVKSIEKIGLNERERKLLITIIQENDK